MEQKEQTSWVAVVVLAVFLWLGYHGIKAEQKAEKLACDRDAACRALREDINYSDDEAIVGRGKRWAQ